MHYFLNYSLIEFDRSFAQLRQDSALANPMRPVVHAWRNYNINEYLGA